MTDPEIEHARLVSGDAGSVRAVADELVGVLHDLVGVRSDLADAQDVPIWSGPAAISFASRAAALRQGLSTTRVSLERARGALETAATAYETCEDHADHYISFWRNRPPALPDVIEELFARAVNACLLRTGQDYNEQLAGVVAVLRGEDVDLDELDEETRAWVEEGLAKNEKWLDDSDSTLGPLIPNTAATGDDRGLIPQGLGYDPESGTLIQGYYTKDGESLPCADRRGHRQGDRRGPARRLRRPRVAAVAGRRTPVGSASTATTSTWSTTARSTPTRSRTSSPADRARPRRSPCRGSRT